MKHQIKQPKFLKTTLIVVGLLISLTFGLNSCCEDDPIIKCSHKGNHGKDTTNRTVKGGCDTTAKDDTCTNYDQVGLDDLELNNGQTFNSNKPLLLKVTGTGSNGCARSLRFSEKRTATGNVVDIYLTVEVYYKGCICPTALTSVEDYYKVEREKGTGTLEYRIHYIDSKTQSSTFKYFYY